MKKKLSVITGGSSGLGLASAQCLADKTALLLCARSEAGLAAAKKELETYGAEVYTFRMDASDEDSVKACAHYAASLGEIVNVIHTAGVSPANTAAEDILRINAMGPIYITEYFRPLLAEGGVLMLFSSTAGYTFETNEKMGALLPLIRKLFSSWQEPGFPARLMDFLTPDDAAAGDALRRRCILPVQVLCPLVHLCKCVALCKEKLPNSVRVSGLLSDADASGAYRQPAGICKTGHAGHSAAALGSCV